MALPHPLPLYQAGINLGESVKQTIREVMGGIAGAYYKPPLELVIGDIQEADRIMNGDT